MGTPLAQDRERRWWAVVRHCAGNRALVAEFDRLYGTNLSLRGPGLAVAIDRASGRREDDLGRYGAFVAQHVVPFMPLPPSVRA